MWQKTDSINVDQNTDTLIKHCVCFKQDYIYIFLKMKS
jgi:hypothetical protein